MIATPMKIEYGQTDGFARDLQRLQKKFRTLEEDLEVAKRSAIELHHCNGVDSRAVFPIPGCGDGAVQVYKLKKFACRALKGRGVQSGIRITYAFHADTAHVVFIEMYFKADQERENRGRIQEYSRAQ